MSYRGCYNSGQIDNCSITKNQLVAQVSSKYPDQFREAFRAIDPVANPVHSNKLTEIPPMVGYMLKNFFFERVEPSGSLFRKFKIQFQHPLKMARAR